MKFNVKTLMTFLVIAILLYFLYRMRAYGGKFFHKPNRFSSNFKHIFKSNEDDEIIKKFENEYISVIKELNKQHHADRNTGKQLSYSEAEKRIKDVIENRKNYLDTKFKKLEDDIKAIDLYEHTRYPFVYQLYTLFNSLFNTISNTEGKAIVNKLPSLNPVRISNWRIDPSRFFEITHLKDRLTPDFISYQYFLLNTDNLNISEKLLIKKYGNDINRAMVRNIGLREKVMDKLANLLDIHKLHFIEQLGYHYDCGDNWLDNNKACAIRQNIPNIFFDQNLPKSKNKRQHIQNLRRLYRNATNEYKGSPGIANSREMLLNFINISFDRLKLKDNDFHGNKQYGIFVNVDVPGYPLPKAPYQTMWTMPNHVEPIGILYEKSPGLNFSEIRDYDKKLRNYCDEILKNKSTRNIISLRQLIIDLYKEASSNTLQFIYRTAIEYPYLFDQFLSNKVIEYIDKYFESLSKQTSDMDNIQLNINNILKESYEYLFNFNIEDLNDEDKESYLPYLRDTYHVFIPDDNTSSPKRQRTKGGFLSNL